MILVFNFLPVTAVSDSTEAVSQPAPTGISNPDLRSQVLAILSSAGWDFTTDYTAAVSPATIRISKHGEHACNAILTCHWTSPIMGTKLPCTVLLSEWSVLFRLPCHV